MLRKYVITDEITDEEKTMAKKVITENLIKAAKTQHNGGSDSFPMLFDENTNIDEIMVEGMTASLALAGILQHSTIIKLDGIMDVFRDSPTIKDVSDRLIDENYII